MRMSTAGWWPQAGRNRLGRLSPRHGLRVLVLAVVMVAAGMTAGSAPAASRSTTTRPARSTTAATATDGAIWAVDPGGSFKASGPVQIADAKTGAVAKCASLTLGGTLQVEVDTDTGLGSITSASFAGCTIGKTSITVAAHGLPWTMDAVGYDATTGEVTGAIGGIDLVVNGPGCSATLDGTAAGADDGLTTFTYTNSSSQLTLGATGNLHWWGVSGCSGLVGNDGPAQASGTITVTPAQVITQSCAPYRAGINLNPNFPAPNPPSGAQENSAPEPGCAWVAGFTNASKLDEAAFIGPAFADLEIGLVTYFLNAPNYIQSRNAGLPQYDGKAEFPPARATLLGFGFMPVSATLQLSEVGTLNAVFLQRRAGLYGCKPKDPKKKYCAVTTITARLALRLYDVSVNGTPLNVGLHCQTTNPFTVTLEGPYPAYQITSGGPLTGSVDIPSFKGCSDDGDNLDSIFTASVSGPDNEALLTQGLPCVPFAGQSTTPGCPPVKPIPKH
ncbi:MAG TPA: hypothetical protein VGH27_14510 [Streptosporangiaceae bacterium]